MTTNAEIISRVNKAIDSLGPPPGTEISKVIKVNDIYQVEATRGGTLFATVYLDSNFDIINAESESSTIDQVIKDISEGKGTTILAPGLFSPAPAPGLFSPAPAPGLFSPAPVVSLPPAVSSPTKNEPYTPLHHKILIFLIVLAVIWYAFRTYVGSIGGGYKTRSSGGILSSRPYFG